MQVKTLPIRKKQRARSGMNNAANALCDNPPLSPKKNIIK